MTKTRLRQLLAQPEGTAIHAFLAALVDYQQTSAGHKRRLRNRYVALDAETQAAIAASPTRLRGLWRGDDGQSPHAAMSWTNSKATAAFFGNYALPVTDLASIGGSIDTERVRRLIENVRDLADYDVGDDEGEVILLDAVWKPMGWEQLDRTRRA